MNRPLSVVLVEASWAGHHPIWFKEYIKAALALGWNVLAVCPHPEELEVPVGCEDRMICERFIVGKCGISKLPGHTSNIVYWWHISRNLRRFIKGAKNMGWSDFRIFFAAIYDDAFRWFPLGERFLQIPWSGLYMQSGSFHLSGSRSRIDQPERLFRNSRCTGVAVLDETIVSTFKQRLGNRKILIFPDISDPSLPDQPGRQAVRIHEFAAGRRVVGLLGHLIPRKGVMDFLQAAERLRNHDLCFVLAGDLSEWLYDAGTLDFLKRAAEGGVSNVLGIYGRIDCQKIYNSIVQACDVIFAAYRNFPNSSNTITKAAQMRRPIIVSDGYVMASRVKKYKLGLCVPEGDVDAIIRAIETLSFGDGKNWFDPDGAAQLVLQHSIEHLPSLFYELLDG